MPPSDSTPPAKRPVSNAAGTPPKKPASQPAAPAKKTVPSTRQLNQLADLIDDLLERNDYPEVIRIIEELPASQRTLDLNEMLAEAHQLKQQVEKLELAMEKHLNQRDIKALEKTVDRLLSLRPSHPRALEIDDALSRYGKKGMIKILKADGQFDAAGNSLETWQILVGLGTIFAVFVGVSIWFIVYLKKSQPAIEAAAGDLLADNKEAEVVPDEGVQGNNLDAYNLLLGKQAVDAAGLMLQKRFGKDRIAKVVIENVGEKSPELHHYVERKLFKLAYPEYEAAAQNAAQATEANRQQAEQQARAQLQEQKRHNPFGMHSVWQRYTYRLVKSDIPYPEVRGGRIQDGQLVYFVGPVIDLNQFSARMNVGTVKSTDAGARTVTVESAIPSPVPDIDLEELYIQHGKESVVVLELKGAKGEQDRVTYFLETQLTKLSGNDQRLVMVGPKLLEPEHYLFYLAPIKDLDDFLTGIDFGNVTELDRDVRKAVVAANLPADLPKRPTAAELAEMERQAREEERLAREAERRPRDGESEVDFFLRVALESTTRDDIGKAALELLRKIDVDAGRQTEVGDTVAELLDNRPTWADEKLLMQVAEVWHSPKVVRALQDKLTSNDFRSNKEQVLKSLGRIRTPESAKVIATLMTDRWLAKNASRALRDMGPPAEDTVLQLALDPYDNMRAEAYDILAEIGTDKGLTRLKALVIKEKNKQGKEILKASIERLTARLEQEKNEPPAVAEKPAKAPAVASNDAPKSAPAAEAADPPAEPAAKPAPKPKKPKKSPEEETEVDVAIRILEGGDANPQELEEVLKTLSNQEFDPAIQDDVAQGLIRGLDNTWVWHRRDHYIKAMETWMCPKLLKEVGRMLADDHPKIPKEDLLKLLARTPSEEGAAMAAPLLRDNWQAKNASRALRDMGEAAEKTVLRLASDKFASIRAEAYDILSEIGTQTTLDRLKAMVVKEKDKQAKEILKNSIESLDQRLQSENAES